METLNELSVSKQVVDKDKASGDYYFLLPQKFYETARPLVSLETNARRYEGFPTFYHSPIIQI